ncbi:peptidase [Bifidobacterium dolichotidis]|uniref:Peptidase n=1 Tax=Bifidobacterium dolichotidis TaxID=2306976 RepID=A0A430FSK3_9BIFI|nr:hypothetical protein [Bifidobacterium dolichotidis]RSX55839.1 peptidase [Bifidobacterium dolichotidis]
MSDFRKTTAAPLQRQQSQPQESTNIVTQIVDALKNGSTINQEAVKRRLPQAFVEQIAQHAIARGDLTVVKLDGACGSSCTPDKNSVICASCPLAHVNGVKRRTLPQAAAERLMQWFGRRN